jgi:hypothetical protein
LFRGVGVVGVGAGLASASTLIGAPAAMCHRWPSNSAMVVHGYLVSHSLQ